MNIVLFGIQGSGKGTLVLDLENYLEFSIISVGQLLREEVETGSKLGQRLKEIMDAGSLVDTKTIMSVISHKLETTKSIVMFDGFPRNQEQAEEFDKIANVDLVIYLNLTKEKAVDRILNRVTCSECGNIESKLENNTGICQECGGALEVRSDDTLEAIQRRFENYEKNTYPLLERYRKRGVVFEVDASKTPEEVRDIVLKVIKNEYNNKK